MDVSIISALSIPSRVRRMGEADHPGKAGQQVASGNSPPLPQLVRIAEELTAQGPPVDYARIAQVRAAIASGAYTIDLDAIASAMLANRGAIGDDV